jgi:hypothetical protein
MSFNAKIILFLLKNDTFFASFGIAITTMKKTAVKNS